jgi:Rieske Fe-S protein
VSHQPGQIPHVPPPSLAPIGFAVGIAVLLVGLIVSPKVVAPVGAVIAVIFGFLWIRDVTRDVSGHVDLHEETVEVERPAAEPLPANEGEAAMAAPAPGERFPRSKFLEAATLGLGGVIGGIVTVPAIGFAILPAFLDQDHPEVDVGPLDSFPEGQWLITTFLTDPDQGEVSRRTAYVRNNGNLDGKPSFTILSNRCVHLGCPVQANGLPKDDETKTIKNKSGAEVRTIPVQPAGFGCPCHGGQYDNEGNRTAGPPVRALDRYDYAIRQSRVFLQNTYSVAWVKGEGAAATMKRYKSFDPGQHVDGPEQILYPVPAPDQW